jgi:hypothetical protein
MMIASPALAQTAPAGGHAGHVGHAAPAGSNPSGAQAGHAAPASDPHAGHDMSGGMMDCCKKGADGTMACCAKMKAEGKKMPCCDKPAATASSKADPHAGHNMSPKN